MNYLKTREIIRSFKKIFSLLLELMMMLQGFDLNNNRTFTEAKKVHYKPNDSRLNGERKRALFFSKIEFLFFCDFFNGQFLLIGLN